MTKASDCKCVKCARQAVAFWPCVDPDIPSRPYCRKCLDSAKLAAITSVLGDEKVARAMMKAYKKQTTD